MREGLPQPYLGAAQALRLDNQETSLFLLGVLMARVAAVQYKDSDGRSKPILDKLNYTGMSAPRLLAFATSLFEKLRQNRLLVGEGAAGNERLYSEAMRLLTSERNQWRLSDQANVYHLLVGYSYETNRMLTKEENAEGDLAGMEVDG